MTSTLILGGPGAGKTTRLLSIMKAALDRGVPPERVAFVSYTNAAVDEARGRAMGGFKLQNDALPYFRTLHSLAFRELGLARADVVGEDHLAELADVTGEMVTLDGADSTMPAAGRNADPLLTLDHYARMTGTSLCTAWEDHGGEIDWWRLRRFSEAYRLFKQDHDLVDFTDMLERYVAAALPPAPVEVAIVDEAQDLTALQWRVVAAAFRGVPELWLAGDDDQSVHKWAGAADGYLNNLQNITRETLSLSHRLPAAVFALSQEIAGRMRGRLPKPMQSAGHRGVVDWLARPEEVDLSSGTWLLLARTRGMLAELAAHARRQGCVYSIKGASSVDAGQVAAIQGYERLRRGDAVDSGTALAVLRAAGRRHHDELDERQDYRADALSLDVHPIWHDALVQIPLQDREYYLSCLRRGERLTAAPRVRVETIHGAKGMEAESVLLRTDIGARCARGMELDPDAEHRVFYVGVTRASRALYPVVPQGPYAYTL